jgi:hypothetical protein
MKAIIISFLIALLTLPFEGFSQTYFPLPEENAYWTVVEFDYNTGRYNDVIYTVDGDTVINNLGYKMVYRLDDWPTIYDTISTLHCFMRQSVEEKKIWFIRNYLGETQEKLGYDLSAEVGDTVSLPAFHFGSYGDSLFFLQSIDSVEMDFIGELSGFRKSYFFVPLPYNGINLQFIEGLKDHRSTFPNLDSFFGFDAFHQSETVCVEVSNTYWFGYEPFNNNCGFMVVGTDNYSFKKDLEVFPNPAWDIITVRLPDTFISPGILTIYNNFGELVLRREISRSINSFAIDVSNFISGIYFMSVNSNSTTVSSKLIVKH